MEEMEARQRPLHRLDPALAPRRLQGEARHGEAGAAFAVIEDRPQLVELDREADEAPRQLQSTEGPDREVGLGRDPRRYAVPGLAVAELPVERGGEGGSGRRGVLAEPRGRRDLQPPEAGALDRPACPRSGAGSGFSPAVPSGSSPPSRWGTTRCSRKSAPVQLRPPGRGRTIRPPAASQPATQ